MRGVRGAGFHLELPLNLLDGDGRVEFEVVGSRIGRRTARLHAGWLRSAAALPLHHELAGFENYQDLWILRRPA